MNEDIWIPIVSVIFGNITFIAVLAAWWSVKRKRIQAQTEVQTKLIERFGSSTELVEFLKSETGREFVHGVQKGANAVIRDKALGGIRKSIILSFLGMGLIVVWAITGAEWVSWFGVMFLALGLGYLAAAYVSMRLSRESVESDHAATQV